MAGAIICSPASIAFWHRSPEPSKADSLRPENLASLFFTHVIAALNDGHNLRAAADKVRGRSGGEADLRGVLYDEHEGDISFMEAEETGEAKGAGSRRPVAWCGVVCPTAGWRFRGFRPAEKQTSYS